MRIVLCIQNINKENTFKNKDSENVYNLMDELKNLSGIKKFFKQVNPLICSRVNMINSKIIQMNYL